MKRVAVLLLALVLLFAAPKPASSAPNANAPAPAAAANPPVTQAQMQALIDRLSQSNRDLLDLLKKQQAVLNDMEYDRRLQSRQINLVEGRLEDTLQENAQLQAKVAQLQAGASAHPAETANAASASPGSTAAAAPEGTETPPSAPAAPASYLPPAPADDGGSGTWHRLLTLSGSDSKTTDIFHVVGSHWRVLWHNQDKPGKTFENTSALFINAFPKDDTIPQKVCSKLGSGGDSADLLGPGNYYLKVEASGGDWELAVEDFR
jgi:hypothetical protein